MPAFKDVNGDSSGLLFADGNATPFGGADVTFKSKAGGVDLFGLTTFTTSIKAVKKGGLEAGGLFGDCSATPSFAFSKIDLGPLGVEIAKVELKGTGCNVESKLSFGGIDKNLSAGINGSKDDGLKEVKVGYKDLAGINLNAKVDLVKNATAIDAGMALTSDISAGLKLTFAHQGDPLSAASIAASYGADGINAGLVVNALKQSATLDLSATKLAPDVSVGTSIDLSAAGAGDIELGASYSGVANLGLNFGLRVENLAPARAALAAKYTLRKGASVKATVDMNLDGKATGPTVGFLCELA